MSRIPVFGSINPGLLPTSNAVNYYQGANTNPLSWNMLTTRATGQQLCEPNLCLGPAPQQFAHQNYGVPDQFDNKLWCYRNGVPEHESLSNANQLQGLHNRRCNDGNFYGNQLSLVSGNPYLTDQAGAQGVAATAFNAFSFPANAQIFNQFDPVMNNIRNVGSAYVYGAANPASGYGVFNFNGNVGTGYTNTIDMGVTQPKFPYNNQPIIPVYSQDGTKVAAATPNPGYTLNGQNVNYANTNFYYPFMQNTGPQTPGTPESKSLTSQQIYNQLNSGPFGAYPSMFEISNAVDSSCIAPCLGINSQNALWQGLNSVSAVRSQFSGTTPYNAQNFGYYLTPNGPEWASSNNWAGYASPPRPDPNSYNYLSSYYGQFTQPYSTYNTPQSANPYTSVFGSSSWFGASGGVSSLPNQSGIGASQLTGSMGSSNIPAPPPSFGSYQTVSPYALPQAGFQGQYSYNNVNFANAPNYSSVGFTGSAALPTMYSALFGR